MDFPDIAAIPQDLETPAVLEGEPTPGVRVRQVDPAYAGADVHHTLYLPTDWVAGKRYPVIIEYAGNGPLETKYGDICTGTVEGCSLGYGISAGRGFIWACLPYISADCTHNQLWWWGDVAATVDYCKRVVPRICRQHGGDARSVLLAGFSRGAIACNYIGLHDDEVAGLWSTRVTSSLTPVVTAASSGWIMVSYATSSMLRAMIAGPEMHDASVHITTPWQQRSVIASRPHRVRIMPSSAASGPRRVPASALSGRRS